MLVKTNFFNCFTSKEGNRDELSKFTKSPDKQQLCEVARRWNRLGGF